MSGQLSLRVDLDDSPVKAEVRNVAAGPYSSWHLVLTWGASEVTFDTGDSQDIEDIIYSLLHDLMLLKQGAKRTVDGRPSSEFVAFDAAGMLP